MYYNPLLVRDKPLKAPAFMKFIYCKKHFFTNYESGPIIISASVFHGILIRLTV